MEVLSLLYEHVFYTAHYVFKFNTIRKCSSPIVWIMDVMYLHISFQVTTNYITQLYMGGWCLLFYKLLY